MMQFDKDGDGKLSKDELPERMAGMLERGDTNKDGFLSREELVALARSQMGGPGGERGRGRGRGHQRHGACKTQQRLTHEILPVNHGTPDP